MLISFAKSTITLLFFVLLWLSPSFEKTIFRYFNQIEHFLTKHKKPILFITFGLYISITVLLQLYHSLDGDETQAWLIARDSPSLLKMYGQMGYEGSPGLWHTILFPLAKFNVPFQVMYFLNYFFAIAAVLIWLRFAPFPLFVRLLFPFIHVFLTEYSIIARSYALSTCLLFIAITLHRNNYSKWLFWSLAFLLFANTNVHSALLTCGFMLFLFLNWIFLKSKTDGKAMLVIGVGLVLVFIQVYPPPDLATELATFKLRVSFNYVTADVITGASSLSVVIYLALIVQVLITVKNKFILYGLLTAQLAILFLLVFRYPGGLRHHFYLILGIIMFLWIYHGEESKKTRLYLFLLTILFMMITTSGVWTKRNIKNFSEWKKEMAYFINNNLKPDSTTFIACYPGSLSVSVLPYMKIRSLYLTDENKWGSFATWNQQKESGSFNPGIVKNIINLSKNHTGYKHYYYLTIDELPQDSLNYYHIELLKKTTNRYLATTASRWHTIYLYKLPEK